MSDRETIVQVLRKAESRIRVNLFVRRLASSLFVLVLTALGFTILTHFLPVRAIVGRGFWILWFVALAALMVRSRPGQRSLNAAAAEVDRKARLEDEIISAYWFVNHTTDDPWVDLHIRRAAETARRLDLKHLCPRVLPPACWAAAAGLVLLVALQFAPLPFADNLALSRPAASAPALDTATVADELNRIDELLEEAEQLRPDETIDRLQQVVGSMRESGESLDQTPAEMRDVRNRLDQENLDLASILEGLEEMGQDLMRSEDAQAAGQALRQRALEDAASELERLAEEISRGQSPSEDLGEALERASANERPGLEELADQLGQAAEGLKGQDSGTVAEALDEAAGSLTELAEMVASQQLKNEAASRLEDLREALERQGAEQQAQAGENGAEQPGPGEQLGEYSDQEPTAPLGEMAEGMEAEAGSELQPDEGEFAPDPAGSVDGAGRAGVPSSDDMALMNSPGMTYVPSNTGFSPEVKEGAATSLEVQLEEQRIEAEVGETAGENDEEEKEEASRQERSRLEYRDVPSELTPAQQDLLNRDRIPREYRNLIKEYFQAIRPAPRQ